ncbi:MAG: hypothetical protein ACHQ53_14195 [Polyangiales bacterium]
MRNDEEETRQAARAFRASSQPLAIAVVANVALAALFLGVPYWRGHAQAKSALRDFARFSACLFGAQAKQSLGLGLPLGERAHFAARVMLADQRWPGQCKPALQAIAPPEAIFLWPSVKQAAADARATVRLVDAELSQLVRARSLEPLGRVPERPLLALARLRAALALLARAANADATLDADAIAFDKPAALAEPARLPIVAGSSALLEVWPGEDGLYALAMDGRGVSWLRLAGGKLDHRRFKRTSLVRAALRSGEQPVIVWAMSAQRCEDDAHHCVRRATGVARLPADAEALPVPSWLGGHPAGRADRSLRIMLDDRVDLLARANEDGGLELRRYKLAPSEHEDAPPSAPLERIMLPASAPPEDALLLPGTPAAIVYAVPDEAGMQAWLWRYDPNEAPVALGPFGGGSAFAVACETPTARYVAFGSERALSVSRVPQAGAPVTVLAPTPLALGEPLHPEDPSHDRVRLLCRGEDATVVLADADRHLVSFHCDAQSCEQGPEVARAVMGFDAVALPELTLVAYSRSAQPQITVQQLDLHGAPRSASTTPGACWDPTSGMCGLPTLVNDRARVLLCARDGADLLALESSDQGAHWQPLSGLRVQGAVSTDVNAPMQQHRKRKGLD